MGKMFCFLIGGLFVVSISKAQNKTTEQDSAFMYLDDIIQTTYDPLGLVADIRNKAVVFNERIVSSLSETSIRKEYQDVALGMIIVDLWYQLHFCKNVDVELNAIKQIANQLNIEEHFQDKRILQLIRNNQQDSLQEMDRLMFMAVNCFNKSARASLKSKGINAHFNILFGCWIQSSYLMVCEDSINDDRIASSFENVDAFVKALLYFETKEIQYYIQRMEKAFANVERIKLNMERSEKEGFVCYFNIIHQKNYKIEMRDLRELKIKVAKIRNEVLQLIKTKN